MRSYAYISSLGGDGLTEASETAVLNANYLLAKLRQGRAGKYLPLAFDRTPMHEFVLTGDPAKRELQVKTLDIAKRLLDYGFHPPTIYFPLLVDEALMVEPTETETRESLDALAEAIESILAEAESDPEILRQAPYTTPVRRLDEARRREPSGSRSSRQPLGRSPSFGSFCFSSRTGAKRSPCSSIRSSASAPRSGPSPGSPSSASASTSSQVSGIETQGRGRQRSE